MPAHAKGREPPGATKERSRRITRTAPARTRTDRAVSPGARRVVFVQGAGEGAHDLWDNRLVASLERALGVGYVVRYPRMPKEGEPHPRAWTRAISRELGRARGAGSILVAHSVGAAIALDFVARSAAGRRISAVFLIAPPFIGDGGWPSGELRPTKQVGAEIPQGVPLYLYFGARDQTVPLAHARLFEKVLPRARVRRLPGRDHQLDDDLSAVARDIRRLSPTVAAS